MTPEQPAEPIGKLIADIAKYYIGQFEKSGNSGFKDPAFEKEMVSFGFQTGFSWCAIFAELCWRKAYRLRGDHQKDVLLAELFSASVLGTRNNFLKHGYLVDKKPQQGDIIIMQLGNTFSGHTGIVESVTGKYVNTIEGNTNAAGGREGNTVARKTREIKYNKTAGLHLLGFIHTI